MAGIKKVELLFSILLFIMQIYIIFLVPRAGFEPARPKRAPAPQAGLSTNFNIWADIFSKFIKKPNNQKCLQIVSKFFFIFGSRSYSNISINQL